MDIDYLDHTVVLNSDLDAAAERFAALGFTLSPPSAHRLSAKLDGAIATYTCTANRCAAFGESFVELLGIVDENAPDPWHVKELSRTYHGLLLTFGAGDAEAVERRWHAAGFPSTGVRVLERDVATPAGVRTVQAVRPPAAPAESPERRRRPARRAARRAGRRGGVLCGTL
jgi:Glyoxalase-like domain